MQMKSPQPYIVNILLAEDDPDDSMLFMQAVDESAITSKISVADTGAKLVNHLESTHRNVPDIIFLDMNMPLKNGIECLQVIRSNDQYKMVPVIMYSTSHNKTEIEACYEQGANYYVVKPYSFNAIKKMVTDFCCRNWDTDSKRSLTNFVVSYE